MLLNSLMFFVCILAALLHEGYLCLKGDCGKFPAKYILGFSQWSSSLPISDTLDQISDTLDKISDTSDQISDTLDSYVCSLMLHVVFLVRHCYVWFSQHKGCLQRVLDLSFKITFHWFECAPQD